MKYVDLASRVDAPFAACLKAQGYDGVIRYLDDSWGKSEKCINEWEAGIIAAAGLKLLLVFETCGGANVPGCATWGIKYFTGLGQGTYDAQHAYSQAQNVRYGDGFPIFFAVDYDASAEDMAAMGDYWQSVKDVLAERWPVGDYGGYRVVSYNKVHRSSIVPYHWQTAAWSGGVWLPDADVRQVQNGAIVCGRVVDLDESFIEGWDMATELVTEIELQQTRESIAPIAQRVLDNAGLDDNSIKTLKRHVDQHIHLITDVPGVTSKPLSPPVDGALYAGSSADLSQVFWSYPDGTIHNQDGEPQGTPVLDTTMVMTDERGFVPRWIADRDHLHYKI